MVPTVTLPKFTLVGFAVSVPGVRPVPESGILRGELDALETTLNVPLTAPALVGAKAAVKVTLWLAARVTGRFSPLTEKPAPLGVACEIVTVAVPVLVKVSDLLLLLPTCTLPNARLAGLGLRVPGVIPVPERLSTTVLFVWFEVVAKVMPPLKLPTVVGANVMVTEVDVPGFSVSGTARLLIENPAPLKVADVMVRLVPPLF